MLIVVTDVLTCPRCGPEFGLVALADRLEQRRVIEGSLGCANCRETYPVTAGLPDLRYPPRPVPAPPRAAPEPEMEPEDLALRIAALLGVTGGPGLILVAGPQAAVAGAVAALVPEVGVLAVGGQEVVDRADSEGVSRLLADDRLPVRSASMRGVALSGSASGLLLAEGLRVLAPGGRIVLDPAPADAIERLEAAGLQVLLSQDQIVVASGTLGR
jgi:uncharacterized protein YbaR (Trm112 family)